MGQVLSVIMTQCARKSKYDFNDHFIGHSPQLHEFMLLNRECSLNESYKKRLIMPLQIRNKIQVNS